MGSFQYVIYNKHEIPDQTVHKIINQDEVHLCKLATYISEHEVAIKQNG